MRHLFSLLALSLLLAGPVSCSSAGSGSATISSAGTDDGKNTACDNLLFTTFVRQLIENETADNNFPTLIDDKTFVDDEDPADFLPEFFSAQR